MTKKTITLKNKAMKTTAQHVILTAIHFSGIDQVSKEAKDLAEQIFCSEAYVKSIIAKVRRGEIEIR